MEPGATRTYDRGDSPANNECPCPKLSRVPEREVEGAGECQKWSCERVHDVGI